MAWCFGQRGCALTRDVLLLDAVRLCAGVPARSTMRRDGDEAFGLVFEPLECSLELSIHRESPGGTIDAEKICMVEPDQGKWVVKSAFGIVKHGGVTPINPGKSRPPP
ncbi:unnamed protein product [Prunus armeniaca]